MDDNKSIEQLIREHNREIDEMLAQEMRNQQNAGLITAGIMVVCIVIATAILFW